jgi:NitT/TauT family transport system permease protein
MSNKNFKHKLKELIFPISFFIIEILIWEFLTWALKVPNYFLPRPSEIISEFSLHFTFFLKNLGITMSTVISGYLIANILSFITAVIFTHSKTIEKSLYPQIIILKTIPILALAPLLILWLGIDISSKIAIVALVCYFPLLVNTLKGLKTVDEDALTMFKSFSASRWQIFLKLRLPNSLPYIFSALKISTTLALIGAFLGEYLSGNAGIGYLILLYSRIFESPTAFAAIAMSSLAGILFFGLVAFIEKKIVFWQKSD